MNSAVKYALTCVAALTLVSCESAPPAAVVNEALEEEYPSSNPKRVAKREITNRYTREVEAETFHIVEFTTDSGGLGRTETTLNHAFVKRGKRWYSYKWDR